MTTKADDDHQTRMVTYLDGVLPIKSLDPLITWACKITQQTKTIIYPSTQCLRLSILARVGICNEESPSIKSSVPLITWSARSCKIF